VKKPMKIGVGKKKPAPKETKKFPVKDAETKRHEKAEKGAERMAEKAEKGCM
jgi:hypothetical protein